MTAKCLKNNYFSVFVHSLMPHPELIIFFFIVAFVYASVGFGGGSSYIAILALYALPFQELRLIALVCNIIVVAGGTIIFIKNGMVNLKKILPIVLVSVPMAYLGATLRLQQETFFIILGCSLVLAAVLLWIRQPASDSTQDKPNYPRDGALGGSIGLLSGMVGIGGGICLSPLLNLVHWDTSKKIAATASLFILVNSVSGIIGQLQNPPTGVDMTRLGLLCLAVFAGGQAGSRLGIRRLNLQMVRRLTALLVFVAGIEVLYKHIGWFH